MDITRETIESFLFYEADLLDDFAVEEWLALWTPDACYWVPCNGRAGGDPTREVSLIYDDYPRLQDRVWRLASPAAHSQRPRSRISKRILPTTRRMREGELHTRSNFLLTELRRGHQEVWSGVSQHRLLPTGDSFQIKAKTVLLTQSDEAIDNLSFLL